MAKCACQQNTKILAARRDEDIITQTLDKLSDAGEILRKRKLKKCLEEKRKEKAASKADYAKSPSERIEEQRESLAKKAVFSSTCLGKGAIFSSGA